MRALLSTIFRAAAIPEQGANPAAQAAGPDDLIAVPAYDAPERSRTIRIGAGGPLQWLHSQLTTAGSFAICRK